MKGEIELSIMDEVTDALEKFGYRRPEPALAEHGAGRHSVSLGGDWIGIWDEVKKTFVD